MQDVPRNLASHALDAGAPGRWPAPPVRLAGLATAVPPHVLDQSVVRHLAKRRFAPARPDIDRLARSFDTAGVERRRSVVPLDWFEAPRGWEERTARYLDGASELFVAAAEAALAAAGTPADRIDTVVTVSSTGIATPTLEARTAARLGLRPDVRRVPVFGLGCAGGVTGLALAARLARASPGSRVLMVAVETCTLGFRAERARKADVIASILFGDGAAGAVLCTDADGAIVGEGVEHTWPDTLRVMGWDVDETGLGVVFDRAIPGFIEADLPDAVARLGLDTGIARFVLHPGGAKVIAALESALDLGPGALDHERAVLAEHGNMSAPTVLFVLERVLAAGAPGPLALGALGPGFTASFLPIALAGAGR